MLFHEAVILSPGEQAPFFFLNDIADLNSYANLGKSQLPHVQRILKEIDYLSAEEVLPANLKYETSLMLVKYSNNSCIRPYFLAMTTRWRVMHGGTLR